MAIFLVLMSGLTVAHLFVTPVEQLIAQAPDSGHTEAEMAADFAERARNEPGIVDLVKSVTGQDEEEVQYLLRDITFSDEYAFAIEEKQVALEREQMMARRAEQIRLLGQRRI